MTKPDDDLEGLSRPDLVQTAKDEGVPAKGKSPDLIKAIRAKRAENSKPEAPAADTELDAAVAAEGDGAAEESPGVDEQPEAGDDQPEPEPAGEDGEDSDSRLEGGRIIEKATNGAWWCPFDDHSMESKETKCAKCGAVRDGGVAVRP